MNLASSESHLPMKKTRLFTPIILAVLASCSTKESAETSQASSINFSYELDTVIVDPGDDHFIFLGNSLSKSEFFSDKNLLYNFNPTTPELEVIDLDALTLKEVIKIEKEGPTGIGFSYWSLFNVSDRGDLFLGLGNSIQKLNAEQNDLTKYFFVQDSLKGDALNDGEKIHLQGRVSKDGTHYIGAYGPSGDWEPETGLAIVNLNTMELQKVPLDINTQIKDFHIYRRENGNITSSMEEQVYIMPQGNHILISSSAINEVYIFDTEDDSIEHMTFHSSLSPDSKKRDYKNTTESREEFSNLQMEKMKDVNFGPFFYDDQNKKYWRFTHQLDQIRENLPVWNTYLTLFDEKLNQIHEQKIEEAFGQSISYFKDGSFYSYINLEDELGFVRIKPTYE